MNISMSLRCENSVCFKNKTLSILRDFAEKLNFDKEQKFKSEDDAVAFYKDTVKKINHLPYPILPTFVLFQIEQIHVCHEWL